MRPRPISIPRPARRVSQFLRGMRVQLGILAGCFAFCAIMCAGARTTGQMSVSLRRTEDDVTVRESRHEATICISSPGGIGMASIVSPEANWPRHVTLEFRYGPGRAFRWLESCRVIAGGRTWNTSFAHAGVPGESARGDLSAGAAGVSAPVPRDDAMAVPLPDSLLETAGDTIQVWWVDLFRE